MSKEFERYIRERAEKFPDVAINVFPGDLVQLLAAAHRAPGDAPDERALKRAREWVESVDSSCVCDVGNPNYHALECPAVAVQIVKDLLDNLPRPDAGGMTALRDAALAWKHYLERNDMTYYVINGVRHENEWYAQVCSALVATPAPAPSESVVRAAIAHVNATRNLNKLEELGECDEAEWQQADNHYTDAYAALCSAVDAYLGTSHNDAKG